MPFIPHTQNDIQAMLAAIGADDIEALFEEIPADLRCGSLDEVPERLSEMDVTRLMHERAAQDGQLLNFVGAGAYEHHIPAAVWQIATRGEFYSAYTPYQAEASQGTLQLVYEYQSMICGLTGMDVANASLYDGASALAEAALMAVRANRKSKSNRILLPGNVHPFYRQVCENIVSTQDIELESPAYCAESGTVLPGALQRFEGEDITAVVIQQPNFFGRYEEVDAITDWAQANGALVIAVINPVALALIKPPGEWGSGEGADIVCGEGQPLGSPLASGGPYFGILCCRQDHVRQMPGRIVGCTEDLEGRPGYVLTLQPREQHIRRSKATSNICTNQGLLVAAATIHMALLGSEGLRRVASTCQVNTQRLIESLTRIPGVEAVFEGSVFHEAALRLPRPASEVLVALAERGIAGGFDLGRYYPEFGDALLVCATETRSEADINAYVDVLGEILSGNQSASAAA